MARCRTCGTKVEWAVTEKGKPIPLDVGTAPNGNLVLDSDGVVHHDAERGDRVTHFSTCPQATSHRKQ